VGRWRMTASYCDLNISISKDPKPSYCDMTPERRKCAVSEEPQRRPLLDNCSVNTFPEVTLSTVEGHPLLRNGMLGTFPRQWIGL
jgi:hypothetical protein